MDPYQTLSEYDAIKTFKLNDSYEVIVYDTEPSTDKLSDSGFNTEMIQNYGITSEGTSRVFPFKNCNKFTPPVYKPTPEVIQFCNTTRVIYVPNGKDAPEKVKLEFDETERLYIKCFIKYCLTKNFYDESMNYRRDHYNPYRYIDRIDISIYDNNLRHKTLTHRFWGCRIASYDYGLELDYAQSQVMRPSIDFSFLKYTIVLGDDSGESVKNDTAYGDFGKDYEELTGSEESKKVLEDFKNSFKPEPIKLTPKTIDIDLPEVP
jgi:hypothetical protein